MKKARQIQQQIPVAFIGMVMAVLLSSTTGWAQMMAPPAGMGPQTNQGPGMMMGCQALWNMGFPRTATPLTIDQAAEATQKYLIQLRNPDLAPVKITDFTNHFQATIKERSTGANAFSLLIDKLSTGAVCYEPGPNMMWNTKYRGMGMGMGGPMQGIPWLPAPTTQMPVTVDQAKQAGQNFLNAYLPGTTIDTEVDTFYGFYDLRVLKDGKVIGELSVNGYNVAWAWYHTWHGSFVAMKKL
jgi:hypothetical protein